MLSSDKEALFRSIVDQYTSHLSPDHHMRKAFPLFYLVLSSWYQKNRGLVGILPMLVATDGTIKQTAFDAILHGLNRAFKELEGILCWTLAERNVIQDPVVQKRVREMMRQEAKQERTKSRRSRKQALSVVPAVNDALVQ
jgi:hypothetical protein